MASPGKEVNAEVFSFLHVELVEHTLGATPSDADFQKAALKLEAIGFAVGHRLVERYTRDRPRFSDTLEIIKFICKDFWCRRAILRRNSAQCSDDDPPPPLSGTRSTASRSTSCRRTTAASTCSSTTS